MIRMTMVRIAVARFELTFEMPILAKIVVSAAKNAESSAKAHQGTDAECHRIAPCIGRTNCQPSSRNVKLAQRCLVDLHADAGTGRHTIVLSGLSVNGGSTISVA